jgi:hypothetical protein
MRLKTPILILVATFLVTSAANAITFSATPSGPLTGLTPGDRVTIDVVVVLDSGDEINALGSSAYAYDSGVLSFVSGEGVSSLFYQTPPMNSDPNAGICNAYPSICLPSNPMSNSIGGALVEGSASPGTGWGGTPEVEIIAAIDLDNTFLAQGISDPGLNGTSIQFQLVFEAAGAGDTILIIGGGSDLNGVSGGPSPGVINNVELTFNVVPEPGTALLMGLGLAGLAAAGRRRE